MSESEKLVIIGAGLAGIGTALSARQENPDVDILVLEKGKEILSWMSRKGLKSYPLGRIASKQADTSFDPADQERLYKHFDPDRITGWLNDLRVDYAITEGQLICNDLARLKSSMQELIESSRIRLECGYSLESLSVQPDGWFRLWSSDGIVYQASKLVLATGGERNHGMKIARESGADVILPLPAFLRLKPASPKLGERLSMQNREVKIKCLKSGSMAVGGMDVSARGLEGSAVSSLSSVQCGFWKQLDYTFQVEIDWIPGRSSADVIKQLVAKKSRYGKRSISDTPMFSFSNRSWETMLQHTRIDGKAPWFRLKMKKIQALANRLKNDRISISGMGLPANERAFAGGVDFDSIDPQSLESKATPGLYFAGEILNLIGLPQGDHQSLMWASSFVAGASAAKPR